MAWRRQRQWAGLMAVFALLVVAILYTRLSAPESFSPASTEWRGALNGTFVKLSDSQKRFGIYYQANRTSLRELLAVAGYEDLTAIPGAALRRRLAGGESIFVQLSKNGKPLLVQIGKMESGERLALGLCLDINRASEADLIMLRGIGEKTARAIVELRREQGEFASVEDLSAVRGIGKKRLASLREQVCVER